MYCMWSIILYLPYIYRALESLGPMVAKVFIQAKDDSYEKTKNRMKDVTIKNQMNW